MSIKCTDICFECKYKDCIANAAIPTPWEKEFNAEQRKLRKEKKKDPEEPPAYGKLMRFRRIGF